MEFDPLTLAETIRSSYAIDLVGKDPVTWHSLLERYGKPGQTYDQKLRDLVRMRGPYFQTLSIPQWSSSTWREFGRTLRAKLAPNGFSRELIETFAELGFQHLYEFQEQAMRQILDDHHTLVVAGTGRGKTESWLLPLLQHIIAVKRGELVGESQPLSTKALLIYPTKALAQDQLRRLIAYLFRLNERLEYGARVTIGIFDGDTPSRNSPDKRSYLYEAFSQFRCPIYDPSLAKCQTCTQRLTIVSHSRDQDRLTLALPNPMCRELVDLDFVYLTREDITERRPDILITNPDMLNLRLLDINDVERREMFVLQPRFVVLDEVHTYTELFGSFVGMILRRLRTQRQAVADQLGVKGDERLRIIAASATVANKEQLFSRLCGLPIDQIVVAQEQTEHLIEPPAHTIPEFLVNHRLSEEEIELDLARFIHGQPTELYFSNLLEALAIERHNLPSEEAEAAEAFADLMYDRLRDDPTRTPKLNALRSLHRTLSASPMTPDELTEYLSNQYPDLDEAGARLLLHNFLVIGAISGLVEGRAHMFAWPIDGMYMCVECGKVYDEQSAACESCGGRFISKLVVCSICGQEAIESWMCPHCERLYPMAASVEGELVYYRSFRCTCSSTAQEAVRVLWRPYYHCTECGIYEQIATIPSCASCNSRLELHNGHQVCSNPECGRVYSSYQSRRCSRCDGALELASDSEERCPDCGLVGVPSAEGRCTCGGLSNVTLRLPWACKRCGRPTWRDTPGRCECGGTSFALAALFDLTSGQSCSQCGDVYLDGHGCTRPGHQTSSTDLSFREYKVVDNHWHIERPAQWRHIVPCYHRGAQYQKGSRYEPLMRSPANVAVTSAQYALRSIVGHCTEGELAAKLKAAKMMAFSDSYADMEELGRDFNEPEMDTFIDQLVVDVLMKGERTLSDLIDTVLARVKNYNEVPQSSTSHASERYDWVKHFGGKAAIVDMVESRFLPGYYRFRWRLRPALTSEGLANVHLSRVPSDQHERRLLSALLRRNRGRMATTREDLLPEFNNYDMLCEQLIRSGFLRHDHKSDRLFLNPDLLVCVPVAPGSPISWDSERGRFYTALEQQINGIRANTQLFALAPTDRTDIAHNAFSRVAYRMMRSCPLILRSAVYKGDVPKDERRRIEDAFKNSADLHFLSTGPAMEVGIDIGALDMLMLLGTPPNINAYLQRVGRAGRRSKRSLVFSVSKRNPIDFYYYRRPVDLIQSAPQPVPLNDHNEEVLRVSLVWALLDYIAAHYWITWRADRTPDGTFYSDGEPTLPRSEPRPPDILSFTRLVYTAKTGDLDYGGSLRVLADLIERRADESRTYLRGVLGYAVCRQCGAIYGIGVRACAQPGCQGTIDVASERYSHLIEEALEGFEQHLIDFPRNLRAELRRQRLGLEDQRRELEVELEDIPHRDTQRRRELNLRINKLSTQIQSIEAVTRSLTDMTFAEAHRRSSEGRYAYQIRSVSATVDLLLHRDDDRGPSALEPRAMEMAIREYHPYAVTLRGGERLVTCEIEIDPWQTKQLHEHLEMSGIPYESVYACESCGRIDEMPSGSTCPRCGRRYLPVRTISLGRAHLYRDSHPLSQDPTDAGRAIRPSDVYRLSGPDSNVDSTFALSDSRVCRYDPLIRLAISRGETHAGTLEFGNLELVSFITGSMVSYQGGLHDPRPQLLVVCEDPACRHGVTVVRDGRICAVEPDHDRGRQAVLRPGHILQTQGVCLRLEGSSRQLCHSLAHGFRLALEKIGGVLVRSIGELVQDDCVYIYDTIPGGSGVTALLTRQEGGQYRNLQTALEIARIVLDCDCLDGCPRCLYQYGCAERNSPGGLSRHTLQTWIEGEVSFVEVAT